MYSKNILVTTTSTIEGFKTIKYLQPISAHIVLGTNVFSDFMGGLSDIFGGKSASYQKRLNSIYEDAIKKMKLSCSEIGGNCVLGLKIDIDEISGKGKSMFMITAIGTAVIAELENKKELLNIGLTEKVSAEELNEMHLRNSIIDQAKNGDLDLNDENWKTIIENQMDTVLIFILNKLASIQNDKNSESSIEDFTDKIKLFLERLPIEKAQDGLYSFIQETDNQDTILILKTLIKELSIMHLRKTINLIENPDFFKQKIGLQIATFDKPFYDQNDIEEFNQLKKSIESAFSKRGEKSLKKQLLSSKEKEIWICECSKSNSNEGTHCWNCKKDLYGFDKSELNPEAVTELIDNKIQLITELSN